MKAKSLSILTGLLALITTTCLAQKTPLDSYLNIAKQPSDSATTYFKKALSLVTSKDDSLAYFLAKSYFHINMDHIDSIPQYFYSVKRLADHPLHYTKFVHLCDVTGPYYEKSGAFEKSIQAGQEGLRMAEKYDDAIAISSMHINISQAYRIFHNYEMAIQYGKKAVSILEKDSTNSLIRKADALSILAAAYTENMQPDSALIHQEHILNFLPKIDSTDIKTTFVNIGYTYMVLNRLEESRIYTEISLRLYKPSKNNYVLGSIFTNLGMYGHRAKRYAYAHRMFDSAVYYTKKSRYIETLFWIYDERAQVYKKQKNYTKAIENLELLQKVKDSAFKAQRDLAAQEMEAKYQTAKKEKEIAIQKEQLLANELAIKNQNLYATILGSALLILSIISIGFYRRNQFKRKQLQKELHLKDALATIKTQNRLQEQRLRISRDLHDNIGSQLTFIISSIDNLKFLSKEVNQNFKEKLINISQFTSDTIFQLRDTIWAMNKNEISFEDIHTRLLSYIDKAKTAKPEIDFQVQLDNTDNLRFTSIQGMNMFRVIQEAINNAIKYANPTTITITAKQEAQQLIITVKDDGKGFDMTKITLGNGLSNMEKRMSEVGGKVFIQSTINEGTTIQIICKL